MSFESPEGIPMLLVALSIEYPGFRETDVNSMVLIDVNQFPSVVSRVVTDSSIVVLCFFQMSWLCYYEVGMAHRSSCLTSVKPCTA